MTKVTLLGRVRARVGSPDKTEISDARLMEFVDLALTLMSNELQFRSVVDDFGFALVADQQSYQLSSDVLIVQWVEHGANRLSPVSLITDDRDEDDWRGQTSATPTEFAIRGRKLYLLPPPDSGAITADPRLSVGYIGAPLSVGPQGPVGLSDSDEWLLVYWASLEFCVANPSEMNAARTPGYQETIFGNGKTPGMLSAARERWLGQGTATAKHFSFQLRPWTGGRQGGAR